MTDETPDPYRTIPTSAYTTARVILTDPDGNGVEITVDLTGDDTEVFVENRANTHTVKSPPLNDYEHLDSIDLRVAISKAPKVSVERVGEW